MVLARRPARALLVVGLAMGAGAAACGSPGDLPRCGGDGDCAAGTVCERPIPEEKGVCIAAYAIALSAPAAGAWVGAGGAEVRADLRVQASGRAEPATIDLLAGGAAAAALLRIGPGVYGVHWTPAPGTAGPVSLTAVAARGTRDEAASAPLQVAVDVDPPALSGEVAACAATPCVRDGTLRVALMVSEVNLAAVEVALDLDPSRPVPLAAVGAGWQADLDLATFPFPLLAGDVGATLRARDLAGNEAARVLAVAMTRVRWVYDSGQPGVTSPALAGDGTLLVGATANSNQLRAVGPDGVEAWRLTVGGAAVTAPPSVGPTAIWVASQDGRVYAVKPDGSGILNGAGCNTGGALQGTPAVDAGNPETVFVGSSAGRMYAADAAGSCVRSLPTDGFTASPAIDSHGLILAATATATATLRQYLYAGAFGENWSAGVGVSVSAPMAIDASGVAWTGSQDARLNATTPAGSTSTRKTLGGSIVDSPVVLAGGDVAVGDQSRVLHRFHPDGSSAWAVEPTLGGPVLAPLVLAGGPAALLVPTAAGTLHAVSATGEVLWGGALTQGQPLRAGNIRAPAGPGMATAYFGGGDGKLYAVAIEGRLDAAAPWPKALHDTRNTSSALAPLP